MPLTNVSIDGQGGCCLPFPRLRILLWDVELLVSTVLYYEVLYFALYFTIATLLLLTIHHDSSFNYKILFHISSSPGFDRDIFGGSPSLQNLIDTYQPKLSPEEESFLNNQVTTLCSLLNDHDVVTKKDFSKEAWDYMRDEKFFGMKIPKEWGGLGFSTHAVSSVLAKLATQCFDANATVAVPNSLGPGELLARYGTDDQKEYFLPRLANGVSALFERLCDWSEAEGALIDEYSSVITTLLFVRLKRSKRSIDCKSIGSRLRFYNHSHNFN